MKFKGILGLAPLLLHHEHVMKEEVSGEHKRTRHAACTAQAHLAHQAIREGHILRSVYTCIYVHTEASKAT